MRGATDIPGVQGTNVLAIQYLDEIIHVDNEHAHVMSSVVENSGINPVLQFEWRIA